MKEKYLVINAGSSSLKFTLYEMPNSIEIVNGNIQKIGEESSLCVLKINGKTIKNSMVINDHLEAVNVMLEALLSNHLIDNLEEIKGIGHRVLHGGEFYNSSVVIDDEVIKNIRDLTKFGPLHHPGEIAGILSLKKCLPDVPQIATFDTAFHQTIPEENYLYPVPYDWYQENGIRKYGFHGTSCQYITETMKEYLKKENVNLIICHIGSGASISCIKNGKCYNTSMGMTPLDGLMMGTRCGSIDPSIIQYIAKEKGLSLDEVNSILNKNSGLLGTSGKNDLRDVLSLVENGNEKAKLAIKMFEKSIIKYIAQYYFELDAKVDAIVFTAGIGENSAEIRRDVINSISNALNVRLDSKSNSEIASFKNKHSGIISTPDSKIKVMVIPTNEEYMILKDTYRLSNEYSYHEKIKTLKK